LLPSSLLLLFLLHPEEETLGLDELPPSKLSFGKTKPTTKESSSRVHKQNKACSN
jgi:hypothetical protein